MASTDTIYMLGITDIVRYLDMELPFYMKAESLTWLDRSDIHDHIIGRALSETVFMLTGRYLSRLNYYNDACDNLYDEMQPYILKQMLDIVKANMVNFNYAIRIKYVVSNLALVLVVVR